MSSGGRVASSSACVIRPSGEGTGSTGSAERRQRSSPIGRYAMATAEHREPCDSRWSCPVLGAPGGETPPGDSTCVDGAPASSVDLAWLRLRSGAVMCLACLVQPFSRLLALMWFARRVLIKYLGSTPVTHRRFSRLDDRPIDIMPSAPPQPVTPYGAFLSLCVGNRAPPAIIAKPLIRQPRTLRLDGGPRDCRPRRRRRGP